MASSNNRFYWTAGLAIALKLLIGAAGIAQAMEHRDPGQPAQQESSTLCWDNHYHGIPVTDEIMTTAQCEEIFALTTLIDGLAARASENTPDSIEQVRGLDWTSRIINRVQRPQDSEVWYDMTAEEVHLAPGVYLEKFTRSYDLLVVQEDRTVVFVRVDNESTDVTIWTDETNIFAWSLLFHNDQNLAGESIDGTVNPLVDDATPDQLIKLLQETVDSLSIALG